MFSNCRLHLLLGGCPCIASCRPFLTNTRQLVTTCYTPYTLCNYRDAAGACAVFIPPEVVHGMSLVSADTRCARRRVGLIWHCSVCPMRGVPLTALCFAVTSLAVYADEVDAAFLVVSSHLIHLATIAIHPEAVARPIEGV